jgi:pimeloyl-ACP methyl ester carboxylesterase
MKPRHFSKLRSNGIELRAVVEGAGPLVVLVHGWPESWYSYRHQLDPIQRAGFRVAAIDVRGYGGSDKPEPIEAYTLREIAADVAGVIEALGEERAILIGHDWGAPICWATSIVHAERVRAVIGMSVPHLGRPKRPLTEIYRSMYADRFFYQLYFLEPGIAERELEADIPRSLRMTYYGASGECTADERAFSSSKPKDAKYLDRMVDPNPLPAWLTPEDLEYYASQFRVSGFRGPINRYRNHERDFHELPQLAQPITQPALFIAGERDPVLGFTRGRSLLDAMDAHYRDLRGKLVIPGAGHWVQQEAPEPVNAAILSFLTGL